MRNLQSPKRWLSRPQTSFWVASALSLLLLSGPEPFTAEAKKKAAGPDPAVQAEEALKKNLGPLSEQLMQLTMKIQGRGLLSPGEAGKLAEMKYQLLDLMNQTPANALLTRAVYQAGVLFTEREQYNDAYEMFQYLAKNFPDNPYGSKGRGQIQQLEKRFGADYFAIETATTPTSGAPAAVASSLPSSSASGPSSPSAPLSSSGSVPAPKK